MCNNIFIFIPYFKLILKYEIVLLGSSYFSSTQKTRVTIEG